MGTTAVGLTSFHTVMLRQEEKDNIFCAYFSLVEKETLLETLSIHRFSYRSHWPELYYVHMPWLQEKPRKERPNILF